MARKRNTGRSNLGEQSDNMETGRTNIERADRTMSAGAHGDRTAGSEGVDSPSTDQTNRMHGNESGVRGGRTSSRTASRQQARESTDNNAESFSGQGDQKEGSESADGTGYTGNEE